MHRSIKLPPAELSFFKIPFKKGTFKLNHFILNKHSNYRKVESPYEKVKIRKISYRNEILTIAVNVKDTAEETVYIHAKPFYLLVSCSVDTNENHLSRHAYLALNELLPKYDDYDFDRYYWPDFFDLNTSKSKYLTVIHDRKGLDVLLKPKYDFFYKPGQKLIYPKKELEGRDIWEFRPFKECSLNKSSNALGYCLADTLLKSWHSNHFPFLIPYAGILLKNKTAIKTYLSFITKYDLLPDLSYTASQQELNELCFEMKNHAIINSATYGSTNAERDYINEENIRRRKQMFQLWKQAFPLVASQQFTTYFHSYGMKNVVGKPVKSEMTTCSFSMEVPKICFQWSDKGEYYELALQLKIAGRFFSPLQNNPYFFISVRNNPKEFYLLETETDITVLSFFEGYKFRILVLKKHYEKYFKRFKENLASVYEFKDTKKASIS